MPDPEGPTENAFLWSFVSGMDSFESDVGRVEACPEDAGLDTSPPGEIDCDSALPCSSCGGEVWGVMELV